ncbi:Nuclear transport factor 2 [Pelomyxa schiedti]|nr:Nuclear transport factor 2 [Pelomyxa schiedti]
MNFEELAKAFVPHFVGLFDSNRAGLSTLFTAESMMSLEGQRIQGVQQIMASLSGLPPIKHSVQTFDSQPSMGNGVIIFVSGNINVNGADMKCSEVFNLMPGATQGSFYILNYVFRTNR